MFRDFNIDIDVVYTQGFNYIMLYYTMAHYIILFTQDTFILASKNFHFFLVYQVN